MYSTLPQQLVAKRRACGRCTVHAHHLHKHETSTHHASATARAIPVRATRTMVAGGHAVRHRYAATRVTVLATQCAMSPLKCHPMSTPATLPARAFDKRMSPTPCWLSRIRLAGVRNLTSRLWSRYRARPCDARTYLRLQRAFRRQTLPTAPRVRRGDLAHCN